MIARKIFMVKILHELYKNKNFWLLYKLIQNIQYKFVYLKI